MISVILLSPLGYHYLAVNSQFQWTQAYLLKFFSFFTSESYLDNQLLYNPFITRSTPEIHTGIGLITSIFVLIGLLKHRFRLQFILFIIIVAMTFWNIDLNLLLYKYFPGATAIRAGGRCVFLLLPVFAFGLAKFFENIKFKSAIILLILLFLFEQIPDKSGFNWTKAEHYRRLRNYKFPKECKVVYFDIKANDKWKYDLDIMWKAEQEKVYTANGYSGYMPEYKKDSVTDKCIFYINEKD